MATTADFKNGMCLDIDGNYFFIVEFLHVKSRQRPGFRKNKTEKCQNRPRYRQNLELRCKS